MSSLVQQNLQATIRQVLPAPYWSAFSSTLWTWLDPGLLDRFRGFALAAGLDISTLTPQDELRVARLYALLEREKPEWVGDKFVLKATDSSGGTLDLIYKLPIDNQGEAVTSLLFHQGADTLFLEHKTNGSLGAGPVSALAYTLPDKDITVIRESFSRQLTSGAYKDVGANFAMGYILLTPRNGVAPPQLYYSEEVIFTLPGSTQGLELRFQGNFEVPPQLQFDPQHLSAELPLLFAHAAHLKFTFGGTLTQGGASSTLVFGSSDRREEIASLQQLQDPRFFAGDRQEFLLVQVLNMAEQFGLQEVFADSTIPLSRQSYKSLREAKAAAALPTASHGYFIVLSGREYVVYSLTTADLMWLANVKRGGAGSESPRYAGIDVENIVDAEYFELAYPRGTELEEKNEYLKMSYFSSMAQLLEAFQGLYGLVYRTLGGGLCYFGLEKEQATAQWKAWDQLGAVPLELVADSFVVKPKALLVVSDTEGVGNILVVDQFYYRGREMAYSLLAQLEKAKNADDISVLMQHWQKDPGLAHFIQVEMMRPNDMNPNQDFKKTLQALTGPGSLALDVLADQAWGMVVGVAELKGVQMMEEMSSLLEELADPAKEDSLKTVLGGIRQKNAKDRLTIAGLFTEDEDEAAELVLILTDDQRSNKLIFGLESVDGFELDTMLGYLRGNRDKMKANLAERKTMLQNPRLPYEALFLVQTGEVGELIRAQTYDLLGFKLDPKTYPHEEHVKTSLFPSPLHEGGKEYTNLMEQLYINRAVSYHRTNAVLNMVKAVAIMASVFSLARGAGLWAVARSGLAAGSSGARLLAAVVTSITAGALLEGIQVVLGKQFSWKDLGIKIGEAFLMIRLFGWVNALSRLPIMRFSINAVAFVGIGVGHFWLDKKRLPNSFEFNLIIAESILMMTLLHIGTKLSDPLFRRIIKSGSGDTALNQIRTDFVELSQELATEAAKKTGGNRAGLLELGKRFMQNLSFYRQWLLKNGARFSQAEMDAELGKVDEMLRLWNDALMVETTRLSAVSQTSNVFYYRPGSQSTAALETRFGKGKVKVDKKTGLAEVTTPDGKFYLIPESVSDQGLSRAAIEENLSSVFGNNVRLLDAGVYAIRPGFTSEVSRYYVSTKKGSWIELGKGVYMAAYKNASGLRQILFVEETATFTLQNAITLEKMAQRAGISYLEESLPKKAWRGVEVMKATTLIGQSDMKVLEELLKMEGKARAENKSLAQVLEGLYTDMSIQVAEVVFNRQGSSKGALKEWRAADEQLRLSTGQGLAERFPMLSEPNMVAILRYTKNAIVLNKGLYSNETVEIDDVAWRVLLNEALLKLPQYTGPAYRGASYDRSLIETRYKEGSTVVEEGFLSTTKLSATADYYLGRAAALGPNQVGVKFYINVKSGAYIEELSWGGKNFTGKTPPSDEVTLRFGSSFQVQKVIPPNSTVPYYRIYMNQL